MATSTTETEIKYDAPDDAVLPRFEELPQVSATEHADAELLEAQYFDTADFRLIRAGITLRRRTGGHDAGWHLKMPAGVHTRREIRLPLGADNLEVPAELAERVKVYTRGEPIRPAAVITTTRRRLMLLGGQGDSLAELALDEVRSRRADGESAASSWREVEFELTGGDTALLEAADRLLRHSGLRHSVSSAKFERAIGIEPAARPAESRAKLSPAAPAAEVVTGYLSLHAEAMKALDPAVRASEPDAVHQMRVATRRLRSTVQNYGPIIWAAGTGRVEADLKWLATVLGAARDAEVLAGHLEAALDDTPAEQVIGPVRARVRGHFAPAAADAQQAIRAALDSRRYFALLDALDALLAEPVLTPAAARPARDVLVPAVHRAYRRTRKRIRRAEGTPTGQHRNVALHEARKAAKRARYAAEAVSPALGKPAARLASRLRKVQSQLGDHQDSVIARRIERELSVEATLAGENAFSYGLLYQRDADAGAQSAAKALRTWTATDRPKYRRWLG
jgi:CHAD domain-containing protein